MGKSWATMNLKGGVGKTTLTANICRALCELYDLKILIVDTDPQCSLTLIFRTEKEVDNIPEDKTFYNILCTPTTDMRRKIEHCTINLPHNGEGSIHLIPSHVQVIQPMISAMMASVRPGETARFDDMMHNFSAFIECAKQMYDLVVLDTNPSGNIATFLAIKHADNIVSPVTSDRFSIRGIGLMRKVFATEFNWLQNEPYRLMPVLNNIKNAEEAADVRAQLRKNAVAGLEEYALDEWVPKSLFLGYSEKKTGFVHDRRKWPFIASKRQILIGRLEKVAQELATKTGLLHEKVEHRNPIAAE